MYEHRFITTFYFLEKLRRQREVVQSSQEKKYTINPARRIIFKACENIAVTETLQYASIRRFLDWEKKKIKWKARFQTRGSSLLLWATKREISEAVSEAVLCLTYRGWGEEKRLAGTRVWMFFSDLFSEDFLRNLKCWQGKKGERKRKKKWWQ